MQLATVQILQEALQFAANVHVLEVGEQIHVSE